MECSVQIMEDGSVGVRTWLQLMCCILADDRNEIVLHGDTNFHFFLSIKQNPVLITAGAVKIIGADYTS